MPSFLNMCFKRIIGHVFEALIGNNNNEEGSTFRRFFTWPFETLGAVLKGPFWPQITETGESSFLYNTTTINQPSKGKLTRRSQYGTMGIAGHVFEDGTLQNDADRWWPVQAVCHNSRQCLHSSCTSGGPKLASFRRVGAFSLTGPPSSSNLPGLPPRFPKMIPTPWRRGERFIASMMESFQARPSLCRNKGPRAFSADSQLLAFHSCWRTSARQVTLQPPISSIVLASSVASGTYPGLFCVACYGWQWWRVCYLFVLRKLIGKDRGSQHGEGRTPKKGAWGKGRQKGTTSKSGDPTISRREDPTGGKIGNGYERLGMRLWFLQTSHENKWEEKDIPKRESYSLGIQHGPPKKAFLKVKERNRNSVPFSVPCWRPLSFLFQKGLNKKDRGPFESLLDRIETSFLFGSMFKLGESSIFP